MRRFAFIAAGLGAALLLAPLAALAVDSPKAVEGEPRPAEPRILKEGDRIRVVIYPEDEHVKGGDMTISSEGNITLPLIGKVPIAGLTTKEAEKELARIIGEDYLVNPEVLIEFPKVEDAMQKSISIMLLGAVRSPGNYRIPVEERPASLIRAIVEAGGFSDVANIGKIRVTRKVGEKSETTRINGEAIINGNEPDLTLEDGDIVHVAESLF